VGRSTFLLDACVLIDLSDAGPGLLERAHRTAAVCIADLVLGEGIGISRTRCRALGVQVVDVDLPLVQAAGVGVPAGLSFLDHLGFLLARNQGWTLVTNDRRLKAMCDAESVEHRWGLEFIRELVAGGAVSSRSARAYARRLRATNRTITEELVAEFERQLDELDNSS
jgi:hypothetical protein